MPRYKQEDFQETEHIGGISPAWPFSYEQFESYYCLAEELFKVRGECSENLHSTPRSQPYPYPAVPDEPSILKVRERIEKSNVRTYSSPLCADEQWIKSTPITWDAYPNTGTVKTDAENGPLQEALSFENVNIINNTLAVRLNTDAKGKEIISIEVQCRGERNVIRPKWVILAAGAVNSSVLLLRSANNVCPKGLANSSGMVGGNFMWHHCSIMMAIDHRVRNDAIYQKTISIDDFYSSGGENNEPLGHVQLAGKLLPSNLQNLYPKLPTSPLRWLCSHSVDWFLITEDLPIPENRIYVDSANRVHFQLNRPNKSAHTQLVKKMKSIFRNAGYPWIFTKPLGVESPTHQCGTIRIGLDPAKAPLDPYCRSFDHPNLWVVDASTLPTSAAVNPTLTVVAQALRAGDHWLESVK
jgi:choline dehydrogenase-like flavoprotein